MSGRLIICGTPIGNLDDLSDRVRETLSIADVVYAEDTRRTATLLSALNVSTPAVSFFVGNQKQRLSELGERIRGGETVVVVSDAGMPTVSDPGAEAVNVALDSGGTIDVIPGPSAVTAAVAVSGLEGDRFVFDGFLPRKGSERRHALDRLDGEERTMVLFVTPHRLLADLEDLVTTLGGERRVCVARELTKLHQELWWGTLQQALDHWREVKARGEFTVVVAGEPVKEPDLDGAVLEANRLIELGESPSRSVREVADRTGVSRRQLYESVVRDAEE